MFKFFSAKHAVPYLISLILFFYCWNVYWGGKRWDAFFLSDSGGYYGYLPATFIYQDYSFSFIEDITHKYFHGNTQYDFRSSYHENKIDKWFCGTAIAITPFFLVAHLISTFSGNADGYTFWYAWALNIAAIFYCLVGLIALQRILRKFQMKESVINFVLSLIVFGTNLFYYSTSEPAMSHVYSFAFVNLFVLSVMNFIASGKTAHLLQTALLLGLIVIIRPVNVIVVSLVPFLAGSKKNLIRFFQVLFEKKRALIFSALLFSSVLFIQLIFYWLQTGEWFIYSYTGEQLNILQPHLNDFLFSYKKGLFVYLPLTVISLGGFIFLFRKNRFQFYALLGFLLMLLYIFSCWWNWWYGGSFGTRPVIEFLSVFAILFATALQDSTAGMKKIFVTLGIGCTLICLVQTYQYRYYFIHWDKMDKESYWKVFMRVDLVAKKENPNAGLLQD